MDFAQILVVGGCAIVGASLGVTVWRVTQTKFFQKLTGKKSKKADSESAGDEAGADSPESDDAVEAVSDAETLEIDASEVALEDDAAELAEPDAEDPPEIAAEAADIVAELEDADSDDIPVDEGADELAFQADEAVQDEAVEDDTAPEDDAVSEEAPILDPTAETPEASALEEANGEEDITAETQTAPSEEDFQKNVARALTEIAEKLGDSLERLERLEAAGTDPADLHKRMAAIGESVADISMRMRALEETDPRGDNAAEEGQAPPIEPQGDPDTGAIEDDVSNASRDGVVALEPMADVEAGGEADGKPDDAQSLNDAAESLEPVPDDDPQDAFEAAQAPLELPRVIAI